MVGNGELGETAVEVVAREARPITEVLEPGRAVRAFAAGPAEPWDADTVAGCDRLDRRSGLDHFTDDLVSGDERQLRLGELPVDDVEVGAAHAAGADANENVARPRLGDGDGRSPEFLVRSVQDHRAHRGHSEGRAHCRSTAIPCQTTCLRNAATRAGLRWCSPSCVPAIERPGPCPITCSDRRSCSAVSPRALPVSTSSPSSAASGAHGGPSELFLALVTSADQGLADARSARHLLDGPAGIASLGK